MSTEQVVKSNKKIYWIIGGIVAVGLIAAGIYVRSQYNKIYNSCYVFTGAIIKKLSLNDVRITLMLKILNRSDITINIKKQSYDIYINELFVSRVVKNEPITVYAGVAQTIPIEVQFNPTNLLKAGLQNIQAILGDHNKMIITTKATITAKAGILSFANLKFETSISLAELMAPEAADDPCKGFK